jgi:hypothetical protein
LRFSLGLWTSKEPGGTVLYSQKEEQAKMPRIARRQAKEAFLCHLWINLKVEEICGVRKAKFDLPL